MTHKIEPALFEAPQREWRRLRAYPDYEISNDGRLRRATAGSNTKAGDRIRVVMSDGPSAYPRYGVVGPDGIRRTRSAHHLVAQEFLPPSPEGKPYVLHRDDNRLNCVWTNLRWGSAAENTADAKRNNRLALGANHPCTRKPWTRPRGVSHSSAKLTEAAVLSILTDARPQNEIAASHRVDAALIYRIKAGKVWKHLTNQAYRAMLDAGAAL